MVAGPRDHVRSSHRCNGFGEHDPLVRPHPARALSQDPLQRQHVQRSLVMEAVDPAETEAIRAHLQRQHAYDPDHFRRSRHNWDAPPVPAKSVGRKSQAS